MASSNNLLQTVREEDFVEYFLFPTALQKNGNENEEVLLDTVLKQAESITKKYTNKYLWHKDTFTLTARTTVSNKLSNDNERDSLPPHLYGITHFGDNIEDEWFIVFLLVQLSKEIEGLVIRTVDVDGEFLLIEAADYLLQWANPDSCENRVYFYNGFLHIVAPTVSSENSVEVEEISTELAIRTIVCNPNLTIASTDIQNSVKSRISGYPSKIKDSQHSVNIYVPISIAALLNQRPNLISHAVTAFCNRDSIDIRVCKAMKYFPPENRVYCTVTFTRCLYAMLLRSKYIPDRITGWNLPSINSPLYKSHILGVKIACGFEILISEAKGANLELDKGWNAYLDSLKSKSYFNNLLEHSKEYNNLFNKAKEYYIKNKESMRVMPSIGEEILNLLKHVDSSNERLKSRLEDLPTDDDEVWLDISAEDLDRMLVEKYGQKRIVVNSSSNPGNFTEKLTQFLNHSSEIDGVEFPTDLPQKKPTEKNSNKIHFEANSFSCAVQNILNFVIPEDDNWDLDSDSDMSDYGRENAMDYGELSGKMKEYMDQMDRELAGTTIGDSFQLKSDSNLSKTDVNLLKSVNVTKTDVNLSKSDTVTKTDVNQSNSDSASKKMGSCLKNGSDSSKSDSSRSKIVGDKSKSSGKTKEESFEDIESFKPVDIDMNALQNMLKSYRAQMGEAGPSSNMLGPMGVQFDTGDLLNGDSD